MRISGGICGAGGVCVCVCVCVRERERERESGLACVGVCLNALSFSTPSPPSPPLSSARSFPPFPPPSRPPSLSLSQVPAGAPVVCMKVVVSEGWSKDKTANTAVDKGVMRDMSNSKEPAKYAVVC